MTDYLEEHPDEFKIVYYLGTGADFSPFELFAEHTDVQEISEKIFDYSFSDILVLISINGVSFVCVRKEDYGRYCN